MTGFTFAAAAIGAGLIGFGIATLAGPPEQSHPDTGCLAVIAGLAIVTIACAIRVMS